MAIAADASGRSDPRSLGLAPGPRHATPFPFLRELRADSIGYLVSLWREYGDVVCIRMGPLRSYLVARPEHVRHVFVSHHRNYEKGDLFAKLKAVGGNGLLFSEGEAWRRQRRLVAPAFQRSHIQGVVPVMGRVIGKRIEHLVEAHGGGDDFDVLPEMSGLALDVVCQAMFGSDPPGISFHRRIDEALAHANYLLSHYVTAPFWVPTRRNRAARAMLDAIHASILRMVDAARTRSGEGSDLLRLLLEAKDPETGAGMSETELLAQMLTLLVAGHETTAMALCWSFHLLGQHPEWKDEEADSVLSDDDPSAADAERLELSLRVVRESMRLYPPVWAVPRQALVQDELGGYRVPRRSMVTISPWILHRHPEFWDDPERFDPDRFLPERSDARPRHAYIPFGAGGRSCVGEDFALLEATLALSMALRRFDVLPAPGHPVVPNPILTLRPRDGLRVRLEPR
jgi:cytochrome P450